MSSPFPECTFQKTCAFKYYNKCTILTEMPKDRNGECPFWKHYKYKRRMKEDNEDYAY